MSIDVYPLLGRIVATCMYIYDDVKVNLILLTPSIETVPKTLTQHLVLLYGLQASSSNSIHHGRKCLALDAINDTYQLALSIPVDRCQQFSKHPLTWSRYVGFTIYGSEGYISVPGGSETIIIKLAYSLAFITMSHWHKVSRILASNDSSH